MDTERTEADIKPGAYSVNDAAKFLSVSPDTVRRLIKKGEIPHRRVGNAIRVRVVDLENYLNEAAEWGPVDNRGGGTKQTSE